MLRHKTKVTNTAEFPHNPNEGGKTGTGNDYVGSREHWPH